MFNVQFLELPSHFDIIYILECPSNIDVLFRFLFAQHK